MKKYANEYTYTTEPGMDDCLKSFYNNRFYKTKMKVEDLPEEYCDVHRYWWTHNVINTKGVVDVKYRWVKENHFMKDSVLYISHTDKIVESNEVFTMGGKPKVSVFTDYMNGDIMVFGYEVLKCLGYIRKYSNIDLSEVRKEFIEQCEWLKDNQPGFAPDTDDFGKWFDDNTTRVECKK